MSFVIAQSAPRSPRYPRISLKDAIEHTRTFYRGVHRSLIDTNSAYRVLGFAGKSGSSATALGAMRQFGLVDGLRGDLKVSELALRILEPANDSELSHAITEAAQNPEVFQRVLKQFDGNIPTVDEPIRSFLIRQLDFSGGGADDCIASLRQTYSYMKEVGEFATTATQFLEPSEKYDSENKAEQHVGPRINVARIDASSASAGDELVRIPLSKNCTAEVRISGQISVEGIDRLIAYLELMKGVWAED